MIDQPAFGSPCNGCGMCCERVLCTLGTFKAAGPVLGSMAMFSGIYPPGPCPFLIDDIEGRRACGLVKTPAAFFPELVAENGADQLSDAATLMIGQGIGCDSDYAGPGENPEFEREIRAKAEKADADGLTLAAFLLWKCA